jgi:hypothetical protein
VAAVRGWQHAVAGAVDDVLVRRRGGRRPGGPGGRRAAAEQAVMVSCDLCSISPTLVDDLAATADALVARAPGLDPAKIVLNATHTHAGPCYEDGRFVVPETGGAMQPAEYRAFLVGRIGDAVVAAWNGTVPRTHPISTRSRARPTRGCPWCSWAAAGTGRR